MHTGRGKCRTLQCVLHRRRWSRRAYVYRMKGCFDHHARSMMMPMVLPRELGSSSSSEGDSSTQAGPCNQALRKLQPQRQPTEASYSSLSEIHYYSLLLPPPSHITAPPSLHSIAPSPSPTPSSSSLPSFPPLAVLLIHIPSINPCNLSPRRRGSFLGTSETSPQSFIFLCCQEITAARSDCLLHCILRITHTGVYSSNRQHVGRHRRTGT